MTGWRIMMPYPHWASRAPLCHWQCNQHARTSAWLPDCLPACL